MIPKDLEDVTTLIEQRKWVALAGLLVFVLVRLLKTDTKLPIDIPPRLRFLAAIALGLVFGVLERKTKDESITWTQALIGGLISGVLAILIQNGVVDSLFKGREMPLPDFMLRPGVPPSPGKTPSLPPTPLQKSELLEEQLRHSEKMTEVILRDREKEDDKKEDES